MEKVAAAEMASQRVRAILQKNSILNPWRRAILHPWRRAILLQKIRRRFTLLLPATCYTLHETSRTKKIAAQPPAWDRALIICCVAVTYCVGLAAGGVHFSSLADTLLVNATIDSNSSSPNVARAGTDQLVVTWRLNESVPAGTDASYKRVKVKLCFAPISQVDRLWRKTNDDLKKDKTCQFDIADEPYSSGNRASRVTWTVGKNVAGASYFVRAYALNAGGSEVGYGQTTDRNKSSNLFVVDPISGRHASLDIATACFSLFSVFVLLGFFVAEKMAVKRAQKN